METNGSQQACALRARMFCDATATPAGSSLDEIQYFHNDGIMETKDVLAALSALAQETRLAIFRYLVEAGREGVTVGRIGEALDIAPATLSFHLKEMSRAGLVQSRQESRYYWYSANYEAMNGLIAYLTENCCRGNPGACCPPAPTGSAKHKKVLA